MACRTEQTARVLHWTNTSRELERYAVSGGNCGRSKLIRGAHRIMMLVCRVTQSRPTYGKQRSDWCRKRKKGTSSRRHVLQRTSTKNQAILIPTVSIVCPSWVPDIWQINLSLLRDLKSRLLLPRSTKSVITLTAAIATISTAGEGVAPRTWKPIIQISDHGRIPSKICTIVDHFILGGKLVMAPETNGTDPSPKTASQTATRNY